MGKYSKKNKVGKTEIAKTLHPESRKAGQLMKKLNHESRVDRKSRERDLKLKMQGERLMWFKENMGTPANGKTFTKVEVREIANRYFHRLDPDLDQIEILKSIRPKQHSQKFAKETSMKHALEQEVRLLESGLFEMPDFFDSTVVNYLSQWEGQLKFIQNIKMRKYSRCQLDNVKDTQYTESGASKNEDVDDMSE